MEDFLKEIRYGSRRILSNRFQSLLIVLSLALGIGVNAAIFGLANGVLLKPLPYPFPEQIVAVAENAGKGEESIPATPLHFLGLRAQTRTFTHLAAWAEARSNLLSSGQEPERVNGAAVSVDFFPALGVRFVLGRSFTAEEDRPNAIRVIVISTRIWERRFGRDPKVLGARITLDEEPYTVVGVVDSREAYPEYAEFWSPLALEANSSFGSSHWLSIIGRLAPGVSLESAQSEIDTIAYRLDQNRALGSKRPAFRVFLLRDLMVGNVRPALLLLTAVVGIILLISCSNVVNILLVRMITQERAMAIRFALGCSMRGLLRLSLIETSLLSLLGGGLGLVLATAATSVLIKLAGDTLPRKGEIGTDLSVLLFTFGVSFLTAVLLGCLPLLRQSVARQPAIILSATSRSSGGQSRLVLRVGTLTTVIEVALAVPALLVASLLTHSLLKLNQISPGFQADSTITIDLSLPERSYGTHAQRSNFYTSLLSSLEGLPGLLHSGMIFPLPLSGDTYYLHVAAQDRLSEGMEAALPVDVNFISPDLPAAMGIPILLGRGFSDQDISTAPPVTLISQSLGSRLWPGQSPLGRRLVFNAFTDREKIVATVVGVIGDVHQRNLQEGEHLQAYRPIGQVSRPEFTLVVRTTGTRLSTGLLREKLGKVDPNLGMVNSRTLATLVARSTGRERFQSLLTSLFAALALFLTIAGIFGMISHDIVQRRHEIGVRLALGATRLSVRCLLFGRASRKILVGCAAGLVLYLSISNALTAVLFGISRFNLATLVLVFSLVLCVSSLVVAFPVWRATVNDPITALRSE